MYQVIIKPVALEMLQEAYGWYEQEQVGLGDIFLSELEVCYEKLRTSPMAYSKINKTYRQLIVPRFPFVIAYEVSKKEVVIYSIFHTSRNPKEKFKKSK